MVAATQRSRASDHSHRAGLHPRRHRGVRAAQVPELAAPRPGRDRGAAAAATAALACVGAHRDERPLRRRARAIVRVLLRERAVGHAAPFARAGVAGAAGVVCDARAGGRCGAHEGHCVPRVPGVGGAASRGAFPRGGVGVRARHQGAAPPPAAARARRAPAAVHRPRADGVRAGARAGARAARGAGAHCAGAAGAGGDGGVADGAGPRGGGPVGRVVAQRLRVGRGGRDAEQPVVSAADGRVCAAGRVDGGVGAAEPVPAVAVVRGRHGVPVAGAGARIGLALLVDGGELGEPEHSGRRAELVAHRAVCRGGGGLGQSRGARQQHRGETAGEDTCGGVAAARMGHAIPQGCWRMQDQLRNVVWMG